MSQDGPQYMPPPATEGVVAVDTVLSAAGFIEKHPLRIGPAKSLRDLEPEYAFFTPAVLYLYGGFRDAPLADFVHGNPGAQFFYHKFPRAMFRGLDARSNGDTAWNYVLWAVRRDYWAAFAAWMVGTTLTYAEDKMVIRVAEQAVVVTDPLGDPLGYYPAGPAKVTVAAFGLYGSRFVIAIAPDADKPRVHVGDPAPDMAVFAAALYGGDNPLDAVSAARRKTPKER